MNVKERELKASIESMSLLSASYHPMTNLSPVHWIMITIF